VLRELTSPSRYSSGEMFACNFTDIQPSPPKSNPSPTPRSQASVPAVSIPSARASITSSYITRAHGEAVQLQPVRPPLEHPSSSQSSIPDRPSSSASTGYAAGSDSESLNNQDPDVPDMAPSEIPTPNDPSRFFRDKASGDEEQDGGLTRDNVKHLEEDQDRATDARQDKRAGSKGGNSREGGRIRGTRAELAALPDTSPNDSSSSIEGEDGKTSSRDPPRKRPKPKSRGSFISRRAPTQSNSNSMGKSRSVVGEYLVGSGSGSSGSSKSGAPDMDYDPSAERARVKEFYETHGYMPPPRQTPDAIRRRLRVIRRLGLDTPNDTHRETMDRFTRLAVGIFKTKMALVSIVGTSKQLFLSEIGMGQTWSEVDISFCAHSIIGSGKECMIVPNAAEDWRFKKNPFVNEGKGDIQFYAGAPLKFGSGNKMAIVGSLCVIDSEPREFGEDDRKVLSDLAVCVVSEVRGETRSIRMVIDVERSWN
jgi:hypothetical protein